MIYSDLSRRKAHDDFLLCPPLFIPMPEVSFGINLIIACIIFAKIKAVFGRIGAAECNADCALRRIYVSVSRNKGFTYRSVLEKLQSNVSRIFSLYFLHEVGGYAIQVVKGEAAPALLPWANCYRYSSIDVLVVERVMVLRGTIKMALCCAAVHCSKLSNSE